MSTIVHAGLGISNRSGPSTFMIASLALHPGTGPTALRQVYGPDQVVDLRNV